MAEVPTLLLSPRGVPFSQPRRQSVSWSELSLFPETFIIAEFGKPILPLGRTKRKSFQRAVALDTHYARAHANIAWTYVCEMFLEVPATITMDAAFRAIETTLDIDDDDAWSHGVFAQLLFLRRMDDRAEIHFNRALALQPQRR